jgi:anti-sigma-K factor RskA
MSGEGEDFDLLAGIYVLGALEADEAHAVEELAARDSEVARSIEIWQNRLAPLAAAIPPHPAPADLWSRIETSIGDPADTDAAEAPPTIPAQMTPIGRAWRSVAVWRGVSAALALAAAFAGIAILSRPEPATYATALAPAGAPAPAFLAQMAPDGSLMVRPLAPVQVAQGKDLELWALPEGAKAPVSLGVLPSIGRSVSMRGLPTGATQILVSLEPAGGSPTGQPTGPVMYSGTLKRL